MNNAKLHTFFVFFLESFLLLLDLLLFACHFNNAKQKNLFAASLKVFFASRSFNARMGAEQRKAQQVFCFFLGKLFASSFCPTF